VISEHVQPRFLHAERHAPLLKLKARVGEGLRAEGFALKLCEYPFYAHLMRCAPRKELNVMRCEPLGERSIELKGEARGAPERGDLTAPLSRLVGERGDPKRVTERAPPLMAQHNTLNVNTPKRPPRAVSLKLCL
jgi:hypothetical protein